MNIKRISFYRTASGKCPIEEYLDSLTDEQASKITWVLKLIRELDRVPAKYLKKLINTDNIWEIRIDSGGNTFRILCFPADDESIILANLFQKKSRRTPVKEIMLAERRMKEYLNRRK